MQDFERSRAFNFLNEIKKRFQTTYGSRAQTALPYAMNSEFSSVLAAQLVRAVAKWGFPNFSPEIVLAFAPLELKHRVEPELKAGELAVLSTLTLLLECFGVKMGFNGHYLVTALETKS